METKKVHLASLARADFSLEECSLINLQGSSTIAGVGCFDPFGKSSVIRLNKYRRNYLDDTA